VSRIRSRSALLALFALGVPVHAAERAAAPARPDIVLITLDTVRADELGAWGGAARTPALDALAASGVRFAQALAPVPLTLPAHASLFTGLEPREHGLRDNGAGRLPAAAIPIAEELRAAGYATAAAVGSRVLDRRFGLDRGFDVYDDRMAAERIGEFGYAERPAREVVAALLAAAATLDAAKPRFLWAHFYDAHAPYDAPGASERERYRGEIELVDRAVGELLAALPASRPRVVVVVGDHGESFGEHGEQEHGYLLHQPTLAVPLLVAGPGAPRGAVRGTAVATARLAPTLAALARLPSTRTAGDALRLDRDEAEAAIHHETEFPASTFGWSPLAAVTRGRWRFVEGPKPALFDLVADPGESTDRKGERSDVVRELRKELRRLDARPALAPEPVRSDDELARALASLGYLSGSTAKRGTIDPADGVRMLAEFESAKKLLRAGDLQGAERALRELVAKSPTSVPFLSQLARARRLARDFAGARAALEGAIAVHPGNEFIRTQLGELEREAGRPEAAEAAFRTAVELNPRHAAAWLALGELLARSGRPADELAALRAAVAAETESGALYTRLAEIELGRGELAAADAHARRATELLPGWPAAWRIWAGVARRQGREDLAAERERRALAPAPR
jgi:arylsulfatase A-like enzyme/Flp pilus assembly protein TadD